MDKLIEIGIIINPQLDKLGGKIYWLDQLKKAGFKVPKGVVVEIGTFEEFLLLNNIELDNVADEVFRFDKIREQVYNGSFSEEQLRYFRSMFDSLKKPIIIRSSGTQEDSTTTSCAGLYTTVPQIYEFNKFLEAIKLCWISSFNEMLNVIIGKDRNYGMNLLVQEELKAEVGGVAFSINPVTDNVNEVVIEGSELGPKAAVNGEGNVKKYLLLREGSEDENEINNMVRDAILKIEHIMKVHVDMEWLFIDNELFIIQARPITTLSKVRRIPFISVDSPEVLNYRLENCSKTHARWMEKKNIVRRACIENNIRIGKFYYYFPAEDKDGSELEKLMELMNTPILELYDGKAATLVERAKVSNAVNTLNVPVIRIGESIKTDIAGFSTIIENKVFFEAVKGGFTGFYSGDFIPTKYVTDMDGVVSICDVRTFDEEYILKEGKWQKHDIDPYRLELSEAQIMQIVYLTQKLTEYFKEVRTEWIIDGGDIYLFDVTVERSHMEKLYCDGNVISKGYCEGAVKILEDIDILDEYVEHISVRMGHTLEELSNHNRLIELKERLDLKDKIIVCDYPKENLALLLDEVKGIIFERGSLLCHLGIILRERNIPAVILEDARKKLKDLSHISVSDGKISY